MDLAKYTKEKRSAFIIDENAMQIGSQLFWIWFCIEPIHSSVLGIYISEERNMLVAEKSVISLISMYGNHIVYIVGGTWDDETWNIIGLKHYLHSPFEKSLIERVNQNFERQNRKF